ncbi:MAG TPA: M20 family metallopeptidase [Acidimicrobiales bacterium]|nr:M20 family metallopeptidase [Acidimicrobiales bacterium]
MTAVSPPSGSLMAQAGALLDDVVALRRDLHRQPELALDLPRTQARVLEALGGLPLTVTTGSAQSSIVADLDGGRPGPTVLLRADMDALPMPEDTGLDFASEVDGAMHACGHDAHTAMLVGAARLLAARRGELAGRVRLLFQPGEEGPGGAEIALREGLLDATDGGEAVSWAFAIHQSPSIPTHMVASRGGPLLASADVFHVTVRGRGGHASMPHHANDPIPVACEVVQAIQTWVTRRVDVFTPAVVTVASIHAGTTTNVVPESALIDGTLRAVTPRVRDDARAAIGRLATNIAAAHEMVAEVTIDGGYPVTVNDDAAAADVLDVARGLVGEAKALAMPSPVMGAEDFSYILAQVPGAMAFLGTRPPGAGAAEAAPNHSNRMVLDEAAMATGVGLYAAVALHRLGGAAPDGQDGASGGG